MVINTKITTIITVITVIGVIRVFRVTVITVIGVKWEGGRPCQPRSNKICMCTVEDGVWKEGVERG